MDAEFYRGQAQAFAEYLLTLPKPGRHRTAKGVSGRCPRPDHEDKSASFSYAIEGDMWACSCGGGKGSELMAMLGFKYERPALSGPPRKPVETVYRLTELDGTLVANHIRREFGPKDKRFSWSVPGKQGEGLHGLRKDEVPLYGLTRLAAAPEGTPVILTEGEKKADKLQELAGDLAVVLGTVTGAPAKPKHPDQPWPISCPSDARLSVLKGRTVHLWADHDDPGREHMRQVGERLKVLGVKHQPIVWEGARQDGDDAASFVERGGNREQLLELLKGKPIDWRGIFNAKLIKATDLAPYLTMEVPYIVKPILVQGSLTQLQGIPKGGKSAFSQYLAFCLATDTWPCPQYMRSHKPGPVKTLYLPWEDPKIMITQRLSLFARGLGFGETFLPENLDFIFAPDVFVERTDHVEALKAAIAESQAQVVFIDTLSHVHGCDENAASEMKIPMRHLDRIARDMNISIVYLHHTSKGSGDKVGQEKSRGSGAIAAAWHVLIDWGVREKGSNVNPIEVQSKYEHRWINWAVGYEEVKDEFDVTTAIKWSIESPDEPAPEKGRSARADAIRSRILSCLRQLAQGTVDGWVTAQMVADVSNLGLTAKSIKAHLTSMCQERMVEFREGKRTKDGQAPNTYRALPGDLTDV
jgi:hypothetical protein